LEKEVIRLHQPEFNSTWIRVSYRRKPRFWLEPFSECVEVYRHDRFEASMTTELRKGFKVYTLDKQYLFKSLNYEDPKKMALLLAGRGWHK
jgi:hypothetical protein